MGSLVRLSASCARAQQFYRAHDVQEKTTFIIGAGASCELGLPSGDQLKDLIVSVLAPNNDNSYRFAHPSVQRAMKAVVGADLFGVQAKLSPYWAAAERIRRGLPLAMSIDNFLHTHQDDEYVVKLGKLAIAICILEAERRSHLFAQPSFYHNLDRYDRKEEPVFTLSRTELRETWYPYFAQQLMSQVSRNSIPDAFEKVRFVIFNYDRCFEQYLWSALQAYFDINEDEASRVLKNVRFSHPYGSLGMLPWRSRSEQGLALGDIDTPDLWRVGERIRTFTESVKSDVVAHVQDAVATAETLIILGFGYLDQNLMLLRPGSKHANRVISTAYAVSEADQRVMSMAMMSLSDAVPDQAHIEPGSCKDLFDHYRLMMNLQ